ncbi:CxC2 domain-containing protein [Mycena indigotica]|uniref:CxC2 domain-containing protein n=1 Tax=Mycena indigotica TaxID=2126181 RepID=A0A8H6RXN4_9AGAR|nr:CxC2 domain-containing protein [Mycena indigotica]KAF7288787.1 CxC2 domain-containing protein [Mycena indigotica]
MIHFLQRAHAVIEGKADVSNLMTDLDGLELKFGLPVWHAEAHDAICRAKLALSYVRGMGKVDGEASERFWSALNPASWATKEMGQGARQDTLEDKIDHLNFEKNVHLGRTLARKLIVAVSERRRQGGEFAKLDGSVAKKRREQWAAMMDAWYEDDSKPNPFIVVGGKEAGPSERQITEELNKEELEEARQGRHAFLDGKKTVTAFVKAGLRLEAMQAKIITALGNTALATADRTSKIQERCLTLLKEIKAFETLQLTYMPGVADLRERDEEGRDADSPPPQPERLRLYLPSELSEEDRRVVANGRVVETEARLRKGQCGDALTDLRKKLHAQQHLYWYRDSNMVGQRQRTRSVTLTARMDEGRSVIVAKYRRAQAAMIALKGSAYAPQYRQLLDEDVNSHWNPDDAEEEEASRRLRNADGSRAARTEPNTRRGPKKISWIWNVGQGVDQAELHDSFRVEWCKARARKERWDEEVELLREEMKRVLRYLRWEQQEWQRRAERE